MPRRVLVTMAVLAALLVVAIALRLLAGGPLDGLDEGVAREILGLRLQRVVAGLVVGSGLAVGGVLLQSLLRNPLASPDLLGLASGAGLAVMVAVYLGFLAGRGIAPAQAQWGPALVGSLAALALVYTLAQRRGFVEPVSLILVGVIVSVMCGAATVYVQHLLPDLGTAAGRMVIGTLHDDTTPGRLAIAAGVVGIGIGAGVWLGRAMDAAALGEDEARSVGVPLNTLRLGLFVLSGVMTAATVVIAGPIGFVGLVCPHVVRLAAGPSHRPLVIGSALAGAVLIVGADAFIKALPLAAGGGRLPIGVLTALIGGPVFILLLRRSGGVR